MPCSRIGVDPRQQKVEGSRCVKAGLLAASLLARPATRRRAEAGSWPQGQVRSRTDARPGVENQRRGRDRPAALAGSHRNPRRRAERPGARIFRPVPARSASGGAYEVEIRSLDRPPNSCGCIDHRVNGLGTCKHVEGVLAALRRGKARAFRAAAAVGSPKSSCFSIGAARRRRSLAFAADEAALAPAREWVKPWLEDDGRCPGRRTELKPVAAWPKAPADGGDDA